MKLASGTQTSHKLRLLPNPPLPGWPSSPAFICKVHYGYRPVHDIPTPPRTSSPVIALDVVSQKPLPALPRTQSPSTKPMSAPHRGLPPPAAMTLPQPPTAPGPAHPPPHAPPHGSSLQPQGPPAPSPHGQALGTLPAPPQWQGSEDSMRSWLMAKTEEEKRRQEEERTRQETLRLEQRKIEHDMLRTSLDRGIPPPMVPVVFAGMSGGPLPQAALEWAQQYLPPQQAHSAQVLSAQGPLSPENRRESQAYAPFAGSAGVPSTPGSGGPSVGFVQYAGPPSPTRPRAHTLSIGGPVGRPLGGSALPRLSTGEAGVGPPGHVQPGHGLVQQQGAPPPQQQETQSPSIYFHHWQPPNTQAGSVDSPRKRKATGQHQAAPPPTRTRSPPFLGQAGGSAALSNPPPGRRRGHSRQRSDISSYRPRGRGDSFGPHRGFSPGVGAPTVATVMETSPHQQARASAHSVSSLLSDQPSPRYPSEMRTAGQQGEGERRKSPAAAEERARGERGND
ncbi:hypothetical protein GGR56DRAFT_362104 [Xylariaceae sp. FL0804]|nr:hypothetical protein GGR56DRAFT_362104 [Xylariaceae sp. FL0804]